MQALRGKGIKLPFNTTHLRIACVGISGITGLTGVFFLSTVGLPYFVTVPVLLAVLYVHLPLMFTNRR